VAPGVAAAVAVAGALTAVVVAADALPGTPANEVAVLLAVATYALVALMVEHADPRHLVGRLMLWGAAGWGVGEGLLALGLQGHVHDPGSIPGAELLAVVGTALRGFGWLVLILAVPLVFPDGRSPWPGRRLPGILVGVSIGLFTVATLLAPRPMEYRLEATDSPTGLPVDWTPLADALALGALVLCVVSLGVAVVGLRHRWRSGGEVRRQQLLWLCVAFAVPVAFLPTIATELVSPWMFAVVVIPVPVAIAVAMFQRRLYDLQLVVSRTFTWLALTGVVAVLYAVTVGGVGALLSERGAPWLPWVAAGVVAVSFAPLHRLLQQAVNRVTYGQWAQPAEVLAATGRRLADAADVPGLLQVLAGELASGLGLDRVEVQDASGRPLAVHGGPPPGPMEELTLAAYGVPVGVLRWHGPPIRAAERRLLEDVARQLGGVVHSAGLLETVREAQHRLVLAREEERRRLRRDLHDGLGPQLAGLTLQVDTLRNRLRLREADPDQELVALRREIQTTVLDVRRIVEGLRPPALDELGLAGAIDHLVDRVSGPHLEVLVEVAPVGRLPAAIEVAIYRIAQEALTNVVRHASASRARIVLQAQGAGLELEISDDGSGTPTPRRGGLGLSSMAERAEELSGRLVVEGRPGSGTSVRAWLPTLAAARDVEELQP
jgi:signal transduction histidine kinase